MRQTLVLIALLSGALGCAASIDSPGADGAKQTGGSCNPATTTATCTGNFKVFCDSDSKTETSVDCSANNAKVCVPNNATGASCQSAGTSSTGLECGAITREGICEGDVKVFCDSTTNTQKKVDCGANSGVCEATREGASCKESGTTTPDPEDGCGLVTERGNCSIFGWSASYCSRGELKVTSCTGDTECLMPGSPGACSDEHAECCAPAPIVGACTTNYRSCENNMVKTCVVGAALEEEDCRGVFSDDLCMVPSDLGSCDASGAACCTPPDPEVCIGGARQTYCDGNTLVSECYEFSEGSKRKDCGDNFFDNLCQGSVFGDDAYYSGSASAECT